MTTTDPLAEIRKAFGDFLTAIGVATAKTQKDYTLHPPPPVGGTMTTEPPTDQASAPVEPGTPEAFWAAASACNSISDHYRRSADAIALMTESLRGLNQATIKDPEMSENTRPRLLHSNIERLEAQAEIDRLEHVVVHLHGRAGVWWSEAAKYRERGTALLPVTDPDATDG